MKRFAPLVAGAVALGTGLFSLSACSSKEPKTDAPVEAAAGVSDKDINLSKLLSEVRLAPYPKTGKREGYLVESLEPATAWTRIGLRKGDVIVAVDNQPIGETSTAIELVRAISDPGSKPIEVVRRTGGAHRTAERFSLPASVPK